MIVIMLSLFSLPCHLIEVWDEGTIILIYSTPTTKNANVQLNSRRKADTVLASSLGHIEVNIRYLLCCNQVFIVIILNTFTLGKMQNYWHYIFNIVWVDTCLLLQHNMHCTLSDCTACWCEENNDCGNYCWRNEKAFGKITLPERRGLSVAPEAQGSRFICGLMKLTVCSLPESMI